MKSITMVQRASVLHQFGWQQSRHHIMTANSNTSQYYLRSDCLVFVLSI